MNPAAHGIDHIQFRHCLGQKRIPIAAGCFLSLNIIIRDSFEESAFILENQLIRILGYHNPSIAGVVLVGNTIMKCFQNNLLIVFGYFNRNQLIIRKNFKLGISYLNV